MFIHSVNSNSSILDLRIGSRDRQSRILHAKILPWTPPELIYPGYDVEKHVCEFYNFDMFYKFKLFHSGTDC